MNFKQDILDAAKGERIIGVVIGDMGWVGGYNKENVPLYDVQPRGKVLSWEQAAPFLDYEYDTGFGAPECNAVYAWTISSVLFVVQYDGATSVQSVPRNPMEVTPEMPGG